MIRSDLPKIFLKPGEYHLSTKPEQIVTILGSCVAIVMFDITTRCCAVSHCILPVRSGSGDEDRNDDFKYVDTSFTRMIEDFRYMKIPSERIQIKVFGGAIQIQTKNQSSETVGMKNILKAVDQVEKNKLSIASIDVGGGEGRKIQIFSATGEVLLSRLKKSTVKL